MGGNVPAVANPPITIVLSPAMYERAIKSIENKSPTRIYPEVALNSYELQRFKSYLHKGPNDRFAQWYRNCAHADRQYKMIITDGVNTYRWLGRWSFYTDRPYKTLTVTLLQRLKNYHRDDYMDIIAHLKFPFVIINI
jgi:hypothetical protein